ncbi:MAG TPA: glycosyltransferase family 1 protein [Cytophagaceae bacterium]|jgi:glycosyltransferase involved in cell wall biosynthesis|nr:glycosyltransferase family 1 protein [Cytophagaceae bacterium]
MKIALDAKRALNNAAGLGQYSRILINGFLRDFSHHDYHLYTPKVKLSLQDELKGNYHLHLPKNVFSKRVSSYWRSYGMTYDLVKEKYFLYHGLSNEIPLNLHQVPDLKKIVTIHDVIFLKHKNQYSSIDRKIYDLKTAYAVKQADAVVVVSEETKRDLIQFYKIHESKIHVIYQSCDPSFYMEATKKEKESVKIKYKLPDKYILNISSFFYRKNHKAIVEALELLQTKTDAHVVFIGGQGNIKEKIIALIKEKKLDTRFHILSGVTNEEMPAIYQQASLFVYPSFFEGFGIPILEALFSKIPVITTQGGCFEEAGGKDSFYVNPKDTQQLSEAIYEVLTNDVLRNSMVQNGLIHASGMKDDVFARKTMYLYETL